MKVVITNPSDIPGWSWVDCAIPYELAHHIPLHDWMKFERDARDGKPAISWWACRGPNVGVESVLFFILAKLGPHEQVRGELVETEDHPPLMFFSPTQWVADRIPALIPHPLFQQKFNGPIERGVSNESLDLLEDGPVRQVWRRRARINNTMLVFDALAYLYSWQDAVKIEMAFTCSDPTVEDMSQEFWTLGVATGEYLELDFRDHYGLALPAPANGEWIQVLAKPEQKSLDDGQQIPHTGWLLCLPEDKSTLDLANPLTQTRLNTLFAHTNHPDIDIRRGHAVACSTEWEDHYGAFGAVPVAFSAPVKDTQIMEWLNFIAGVGHLYEPLPWGLAANPGQTGGQEDFGACAGTGVIASGAPLLIEKYRFIARLKSLRPTHYREVDGKPIKFIDHPNLRTWSQRPDTRQGHATDSMGKKMVFGGFPQNIAGTNMGSEDDQHRSMHNFLAAHALTGSYQMKDVLYDNLQTDLAQYEGRTGAPRAIGRLFMAWAGMLRAMEASDVADLESHVTTRFETMMAQWPGRLFPNGQIRVIGTGSDPHLKDPDGSKAIAWIVWEHSIAAMGLYAIARTMVGHPSQEAIMEMTLTIAEMVTRWGNYNDGSRWRNCSAVRYNTGELEGENLSVSQYFDGSKDVSTSDMFWDWNLPAIIIANKLASAGSALRQRSSDIIDQIRGVGPTNWNTAEWHAVLQF